MRECEFLSIDKYKTNIENYNTQLKYECGVFLVLFFYSCFVFFSGMGLWPFLSLSQPSLLLSYLCGGGSRREYIMSTLCLLLCFLFLVFQLF